MKGITVRQMKLTLSLSHYSNFVSGYQWSLPVCIFLRKEDIDLSNKICFWIPKSYEYRQWPLASRCDNTRLYLSHHTHHTLRNPTPHNPARHHTPTTVHHTTLRYVENMLKCLWNEILGCRCFVSDEKPFNTEKNAIDRFSISLLVPELERFKMAKWA